MARAGRPNEDHKQPSSAGRRRAGRSSDRSGSSILAQGTGALQRTAPPDSLLAEWREHWAASARTEARPCYPKEGDAGTHEDGARADQPTPLCVRRAISMRPTNLTFFAEARVNAADHSRDAAAVPLWNDAYDVSHLQDQPNLWGDPPVPYARTAAQLFAERSAAFLLDLRCGAGRNLPPLAKGAPILLAGDTSPKAMVIAAGVAEKADIRNKTIFLTTDVFAPGLLDDSLDGIFCWDLLGHLTNVGHRLPPPQVVAVQQGAARQFNKGEHQTSLAHLLQFTRPEEP